MATAQNLFDVAVERSNLNDSSLIPTDEILRLISSFEKRVFLTAARENPDYFGREGVTSARAASTDSWSLTTAPGNVASVSKLEVSAVTGTVTGISVGDEVNLISIRQPYVALAPRVYLRNRTIFEYGEELQVDSSNFVSRLKVYYSYLPSQRTALSDTLDIPEEFESLITVPLARVLAIRDQRPDEVPVLDEEFKVDWQLFLLSLSAFDEGAQRSLGSVQASSLAG